MSEDWAHVERCIDVRRGDVERTIATREDSAALLAHLAAISRPMSGAPLVLLLFARMATNACTWLEGGLCVNAIANGESTVFDVLQDLGVGLRERLLPRTSMTAPLSEFDRAVRRIPSMIAPLTIERMGGQLFFAASSLVRRSSMPSPTMTEAQSATLLMPPTPGFAFTPPGAFLQQRKKGS